MSMKSMQSYKPVSCDLVDQIEINATVGKVVLIRYYDTHSETEIEIKSVLKTWLTRNHEEFLILDSGNEIRLDHILEMNNMHFSNSCNF